MEQRPPAVLPEAIAAPSFAIPPGACDCHLHVFGPAADYPFCPERRYTPPDALPDQAARMLQRLRLDRAVIVQATPYGTDNRRLASALTEIGIEARGVAAVDPDIDKAALIRLDAAGVRGARWHSGTSGARAMLDEIARLSGRLADLGWHLDLHVEAAILPAIAEIAQHLPLPVVLDHIGGIGSERQPGPQGALLRLLETGRCWVKLSAPYRLAGDGTSMEEIGAIADRLVRTNPERLLWGSDWPHTPPHAEPGEDAGRVMPFRRVDTGKLLDLLAVWIGAERTRAAILVDNPARLYGF